MGTIFQYVLYLAILVALAVPLGKYIGKIMHVKEDEEMGWKRYAGSVFVFSITALIVLMLIHMLQAVLPWNPQEQKGILWDLAFNNAVSFITNTNWKAYSGESSLSYFTQVMGLTVQNFSAYGTVDLVEPINMEDGTEVTQQIVPQGPAASQIAIKQLGTNGGGFFGVLSFASITMTVCA